jgi:soluble lytic murein transglycosylase
MSPTASSASPRRQARRAARRRRALPWLAGAAVLAIAAIAIAPLLDRAVKEVVSLPLRHEDIIRQQARDKGLDPALIAAVIYAESKFRDDQTSAAGAQGLMQLTPETARDIARRSGATNFQLDDLADPQVNISYGSYQLRYLLDRYGSNRVLAVAAYNAGEGNVDRWLVKSRVEDRAFRVSEIPFAETRSYVNRVLDARRRYRKEYRSELGL